MLFFINFINFIFESFCLASPASGKLGMRMTTLHEEPGSMSGGGRDRRRGSSTHVDKEDSHSDPENENTQVYKYTIFFFFQ